MREKLIAKIEEIAKQKEQMIAQLNAAIGAEQVLKEMLDALEKEDKNADKGD